MNCRISSFKRIFGVNFIPKRSCSELPQGIKYMGFTYYPRQENFQDPPYEPSKLFFVKRIKSMKGRNPKERKCLEQLNIDGEVNHNGHMTVVKNIPQINAILWNVKHLVEIRPIKINGKLPKDSDFSGTFLRQTGEFIISPKLIYSAEQLKTSDIFAANENKLKRLYLKEYLKRKWLLHFSANDQ